MCKVLNLLDSGSGVHAVNSSKYAIPDTIHVNTIAIATANGVIVPPTTALSFCVRAACWGCRRGCPPASAALIARR